MILVDVSKSRPCKVHTLGGVGVWSGLWHFLRGLTRILVLVILLYHCAVSTSHSLNGIFMRDTCQYFSVPFSNESNLCTISASIYDLGGLIELLPGFGSRKDMSEEYRWPSKRYGDLYVNPLIYNNYCWFWYKTMGARALIRPFYGA